MPRSKIPTLINPSSPGSKRKSLPLDKRTSPTAGKDVYNRYVDILDAYMDEDLIAENKECVEIEKRVGEAESQVNALNTEKRELIRKRKRLTSSIDDIKGSLGRLTESRILRTKATDKERERHRLLAEEGKEELVRLFKEKIDTIRLECEELVRSSLDDEETVTNRDRRLQSVKLENEMLDNKIVEARKTFELEYHKLEGELELKSLKDIDASPHLSELQRALRQAESKKKELEMESVQLQSQFDEIDGKNEGMLTKIGGLASFKGSLDDKLKDLKTEQEQTTDKLKSIRKKVIEFRGSDFERSEQLYEDVRRKYSIERRKRILIDDQIDDLEDRQRLYVITDTSFHGPARSIDESFDFMPVLQVYLEDTLCGISHTVILFDVDVDGICNLVRGHLSQASQADKFEGFKISLEDVISVDDIGLSGNIAKKIIGFEISVTRGSYARKAIVMFLSLPLNEESIRMSLPLYKKTATFTVVNLKDHPSSGQLIDLLAGHGTGKKVAFDLCNTGNND
ncbi:DEKNAAC101670 [Brettanomyces naardenensis]|uniref:DEKNAAC101670 n=1 Tax=Brettanomyces naardenensis TaxID=13370 RepID=A0A448YIK3_BRENA|nr:DEKNAAC101670 [Brettanomyces naardenensis]